MIRLAAASAPRPRLAILAGLGLLLVGVPAWLLAGGRAPPMAPLSPIVVRPVAPAPATVALPGRSLFGGGAAPLDQLPAPEPDAAREPGEGPQLIGIVGRLPDDAVALVRAPDGRSRSIAIGQDAAGWRLAALAVDAALFVRGAERRRVALPQAPPSN